MERGTGIIDSSGVDGVAVAAGEAGAAAQSGDLGDLQGGDIQGILHLSRGVRTGAHTHILRSNLPISVRMHCRRSNPPIYFRVGTPTL